jgi:PAS domain S-box-containing protein
MEKEYSRTLRRQIQKYLRENENNPGLSDFLEAVNDTYRFADRDRELLERTLELTSSELTSLNEKFREERTQALEKLSENEQILRSINENLSEGIFRLNREGQIIFANRAFYSLFGLNQESADSTPSISGLFTEADKWSSFKNQIEISSVLKNEETQMLGPNGKRIWALISMVKVSRDVVQDIYDGSIVNITQQKETERNLRRANDILAHTINIRKKAEEDLRRALDKEKELTELKSKLVSMTSHEFRTPLTTIQTNAEILAIRLKDQDEKVFKHLDRIINEVSKLTKLMEDILLMGRYESGKIIFQPAETDLIHLLEEIIQIRSQEDPEKRTISLKTSGTIRKMTADPNLLNHALGNLISNALKYSRGKQAPETTVKFEQNQAEIKIRDYGIGIPESERGKLFDTFYRASNASNIQGTGMGLVIVKQFIEMHQGHVTLESREDQGTCVTVSLPYEIAANEVVAES